MPDFADSNRLPVPAAQEALGMIASDLERLDERLRILAETIAPEPAAVLPADLRAGVEAVREALLRDAISTLSALALLTEEAALKRRPEVLASADLIAAFG